MYDAMLRRLGFSEVWIDRVWRAISNVWYSINLNGPRHGLFKSTRGVKQGDPLSPTLFVIGPELLSRLLYGLPQNGFIPYSLDNGSPMVNHLCYADDTILFSSADPLSIGLMMNKLRAYENISGQRINKKKCGIYVSANLTEDNIKEIELISGFNHLKFPMQYLGCPIIKGGKKLFISTIWWPSMLIDFKVGKESFKVGKESDAYSFFNHFIPSKDRDKSN